MLHLVVPEFCKANAIQKSVGAFFFFKLLEDIEKTRE